MCPELGANLTGWSRFLHEIGRGFSCGSRSSFQFRSRVAYPGGGRRLSGGDGLRRDGAGREVGRQGRREVPSVECRFEPELHHSLAASHLCISSSACMTGDTVMNENSGTEPGIWQPLDNASSCYGFSIGNAPCCWRFHSVRSTQLALCTLTSLNLTPSPRKAGIAILGVK